MRQAEPVIRPARSPRAQHASATSDPTGGSWTIEGADQMATVVGRGAALRNYRVAGIEVVDGFAADEVPPAFNGAVLAPWPNRIADGRWVHQDVVQHLSVNESGRHTALHGLVAWVPWQLVAHHLDSVQLTTTVLPQPGYPFAVRLDVTWSISAAGLTCLMEAVNIGTAPAPFGIAAHPFFGLPATSVDDYTLTLAARTYLDVDERLLPRSLVPAVNTVYDLAAGRQLAGIALDTAFTDVGSDRAGRTTAGLSCAAGNIVVWADRHFHWWQVYTSDMFPPGSPRHRRSIAIEPMTCGPDAFNTGQDLVTLEPGRPWRASWGVGIP